MKKITAKIEKRQLPRGWVGDIVVLYHNNYPIGNVSFQEMGRQGVTNGLLRCVSNGKRTQTIMVGATIEGIIEAKDIIGNRILNGEYD